MRCSRCKRFAKVVEALAVPHGEGYGFHYRPKVTVECRTHGRVEAEQDFAWEDVFGESCPDSDPDNWTVAAVSHPDRPSLAPWGSDKGGTDG